MIPEEKPRRTIFWLYVLGAYILIQLLWWAWLQYDMTARYYSAIHEAGDNSANDILRSKVLMIVGEGSVFIALLIIGFFIIRKSMLREWQLARMKNTFLLSVTHELKTPLSAIRLSLETLRRGKGSKEQQDEIINIAIAEAERLGVLTENILLTTRIGSQVAPIDFQPVNLSQLITNTVERFNLQSKLQRNVLRHIQDDVVVLGDQALLECMVSNLVENAFKYTSENQQIAFTLSANPEINFEVFTEGKSLSQSEAKRIFDPFYRMGDENIRSHKGTGLGLYLVRNIARLHHARASAQGIPEKGNIFAVVFQKNYE